MTAMGNHHAAAACCSKGYPSTRFYLLSCTVVIVILTISLEDVLFPARCSSSLLRCRISPFDRDSKVGIVPNIGQIRRPLRPKLKDTPSQQQQQQQQTTNAASSISIRSASHSSSSSSSAAEATAGGAGSQILKGVAVGDTTVAASSKASSREALPDVRNAEPPGSVDLVVQTSPKFKEGHDGGGSNRMEEGAESSSSSPSPPTPLSVWYYTKVYKHPEAKLRVLTAEDGAARIRSTISPPEREITIVTQTSVDRLPALEDTCMTWGGAMCIAVHVRLKSQFGSVYEALKQMHARMEENGRCRLDFQMVTEDGFQTEEEALRALYPVNALRNVAMAMATTTLVFVLDADFLPSPRLHETLTEDEGVYKELVRKAAEEKQLSVVAAFEAVGFKGRPTKEWIPNTMEALRTGWEDGSLDCFHCAKSPTGHIPTNFTKFFDPTTTAAYPITYRDGFEPYIIGAADALPSYDSRFRGYGENKVSHIYSCAAAGMHFQVLPNAFVFEKPHPPSQAHESYIGRRRDYDQRNRIIGLYRQFKDEVNRELKKKDPVRYAEFVNKSN